MKKVLVAGATGYLGKHIVNELKSRGYWDGKEALQAFLYPCQPLQFTL